MDKNSCWGKKDEDDVIIIIELLEMAIKIFFFKGKKGGLGGLS